MRRRFYKEVSVGRENDILLDGRSVKTPLKAIFSLPTKALAEEVAMEWRGQEREIDPFSMPLTRLANTAIDRVSRERARLVNELIDFAGSDMVCYRAHEPPELSSSQAELWDPIVNWAAKALDAQFKITIGVMHIDQAETALRAFARFVEQKDNFAVTGLHNLTTLTGSVLLASMIENQMIEHARAWQAAHVDEDYQVAQWGEDEEASEKKARRHDEFRATCRFLDLLKLS